MEGAANQWIGLGTVFLLGAMVLAPFMLTWIYCDRPEPYLKRCLRASVGSLVVIAVCAAALLLGFQSHFPEGEVFAKVQDTVGQALIAAALAPLLGTDFLMRMKLKYKWFRAQGRPEI
jgi:hypothetical protein